MSKRWTDEDVERLVRIADRIETALSGKLAIAMQRGSINHNTLSEALAPFRPDPDEELIEAMAQAQCKAWLGKYGLGWELTDSPTKENYRLCATAALAVIKEQGYFNDQR